VSGKRFKPGSDPGHPILKMPKKVYIDFESRSTIDIWKTGAYRYAEDPSTEILCLAWALDRSPVTGAIKGHPLTSAIPMFNDWIRSGAEFHAHNAFFERCIWHFKAVPLGFLPIPLTQWRDTAAKAAMCSLPRKLELAAQALGCAHQKDMDGYKLMRVLCVSQGVIPQEKLDRLLLYCCRDVESERDVDLLLPDLPEYEQKVWFMDQYMNDTGIKIDVPMVKNAVNLIEQETKARNEELFKLTGGLINAGTKREAIKNYLERKGLNLPDLTKATVKEAITKSEGSNLRILQLRQQLSLTSIAKYAAVLSALGTDGRIRDIQVYHGAGTGRWTGKLVQIQNLVKSTHKPGVIEAAIETLKTSPECFSLSYDVLPVLSSCLRGIFIPNDGKEMFITDFSAIEARVVMWLAGEKAGLAQFVEKDRHPEVDDIYVKMAKVIGASASRQLGKQTILGCGYGMGSRKFQETCAKYEIEVDAVLSERAVNAYRTTFPAVPQFWYSTENAARQTVSSGKSHQNGRIGFSREGNFLVMMLPSGRKLYYHYPKISVTGKLTYMAVNSVTNKYEIEETWGGKLVENATQAVARDLMVAAMFNLFGAKYHVLFTVHDELVAEKETGTEKEVTDLVCHTPAWANGCPVNAETKKVRRYQK